MANGNDYLNQQLHGNYQGLGLGLSAQSYAPLPPPKSIVQQLTDKRAELLANLAKVDQWKAELAQAERMIAAAMEPTNG